MPTIPFVIASFAALSMAAPAVASSGRLSKKELATGIVTACSWQNSDRCESATIVRGKFGPALRLKSGFVIDCNGDCRETLRLDTVDFWYDQRERSTD